MMKKIVFLAFSLVFLWSDNALFAQKYFGDYEVSSQKHLVLTHPTVSNVKTILTLLEEDLIDLENTRLVGVFYDKARYDYTETTEFLDTCKQLPVEIYLHKLDEPLNINSLYTNNPLTDDFELIFSESEGVIFFGGPDMPPSVYNEKTNLLTSIYDPYRHYFELSFLFHLTGGSQDLNYKPLLERKPGYLIYGFCLGMQTMNVAAGASMVQDIPTELYNVRFAEEVLELSADKQHRNYNRHVSINNQLLSGSFHPIKFEGENFLRELSGSNINPHIYSNHHQCVEKLGLHYSPLAYSMDGKIVEAVRHEKYKNVIGVQFHPEYVRLYDEEPTFKMTPAGEMLSGKAILLKNNSYEFHVAYWKDFSERFRLINK